MATSNGIAHKFTVEKLKPVFVCPAQKTFNGLYFLSNLDPTFPHPIEIVLAFKEDEIGMDTAVEVIRESLAKILVQFYPFAGHLTTSWDGKMMVRCTGEGVAFVEATAESEISMLGDISVADPVKLRKLVHYVDGAETILDIPLLTVQVTRFKCGGIILGIVMNHVLIGGRSLAEYINSWAEIARGKPLSIFPFLDPSILRARQSLEIDIPHHEYIHKETSRKTIPLQPEPLVYESFCFVPEKLSQLKKLASDDPFSEPPTIFELISALVWINETKAFKIQSEKTTQLLTAVDGRPKFKPPLPKGYFGNGIAWSCARCSAGDLTQKSFSFAVKVVHEAIKMVTKDYIRSAIDHFEVTRAQLETENTFHITKWSRLPFYDTDFGWGKPTQVAPASFVDNLIVVLSQGKEVKNLIVSLGLPVSVIKNLPSSKSSWKKSSN